MTDPDDKVPDVSDPTPATCPTIQGKPQWDFCCEWYRATEITRMLHDRIGNEVPKDIYSFGFAEWLTNQYRLAMNKGMELMRAELSHSLKLANEENGMLKDRDAKWQRDVEVLSDALNQQWEKLSAARQTIDGLRGMLSVSLPRDYRFGTQTCWNDKLIDAALSRGGRGGNALK